MENGKWKMENILVVVVLLLTAHCSLLTVSAQIAVKGEKIWTMTSNTPIENGVVLVGANGKIEAVGTAAQVKIPANYKVLNAKVVTPGLIDAHSVIGIAGYLNQPHDQMQIEASAPIQPELRAIDVYNTEEKLIEWVRSFGVTTIHTGHAPAALMSGQTMIAKTVGKTVDDAVIVPTAMIAVTLGQNALNSGGKPPGTRAKQAAMLRAELIKAQEAVRKQDADKDKKPEDKAKQQSELRAEIMQKVIRREIPLLVTAHKAQDIMTAIRLSKEFNLRIILDGSAEAQLVADEIKKSGYPIILHPAMYRAGGETESLSMISPAKLKAAGLNFALQSGYETYVPKSRVVLFEAAIAAANGLSFRDALATITIDAARILGIDNRVGSLAPGKDADLALFDGDPFEYTTHNIGTIIDGKVVSEIVR
ncbi:MAG TPA: amidohydrolase family protein [Pyrinomonadaceae bacterium]|nr:amidohydrolase family protein [Pyrinomonadaceae bacterium]